MIKQGLKNYLKCLKHYCIPLGIFALFVVFGLSISIVVISTAIQNLVNQIKASISSATDTDWMLVLSKLFGCVLEVDWSHPQQALMTIFSSQWLMNALNVVLVEVFGDPDIVHTYNALINDTLGSIFGAIILVLAMAVIGIFVGYAVLKFAIRKSMTKQAVWRMILFSILDGVVVLLIIVLTNLLARVAPWVALVFLIIMMLSSGFFVLVEAYLIYGVKKVKFKEVANIKNVLLLYLVNFIVLLITFAIVVLLLLLFNSIIVFGIFVVIPFVEIGVGVMGSNAEGYVSDFVSEHCPKESKKKKEKAIEAKAN